MSENQIITPQAITNESLRLLHDKLPFVRLLNCRYSNEFKSGGARQGDEVLVRHPNCYEVRDGAELVPQATEEQVTPVALTEQKGVDLSVTSTELTLHIDDFKRRYLEPAISSLASIIEADVLSTVAEEVVHVVAPEESALVPDWYHGAGLLGAWFDQRLIPAEQRRLVMNSFDQAEMVDRLKGHAQSERALRDQYETGRMDHFQGFDMGMSLSMPTREARGRVETGLDDFKLAPDGRPVLDEKAPASFDRVTLNHVGREMEKPLPRVGEWITFTGGYPVHPVRGVIRCIWRRRIRCGCLV